jgi:hypothetical protein
VAGLAALVQASCPFTTSSDVVSRITATADPIAGTGSLWQFGRVNAFNAVCFPAPVNLKLGTVTATSQQLLWTDTTPGESSFQVARSVTGSGAWVFFTTAPNATTLTDVSLTPGVSYDHMVRACDAAGCSGWSNTVTATAGSVRLTVSVSGSGKVTGSGINCGLGSTACSALYTPGTVVSLHAQGSGTPGKGAFWLLSDWTGACAGFGVSCTLTMNSNLTTKAVFERGDL